MSDEYGPYIYLMTAEGQLVPAIEPPDAFLPKLRLSLSSHSNLSTGFEGLTLDSTGQTLYVML